MKWNKEQYPLTLHNALWVCSWVFAIPLAAFLAAMYMVVEFITVALDFVYSWLQENWIKPRSIHYIKQEKSNKSEDDGRN